MENGRETPGRRRDRDAARANRLALDPPSRRSVNSGAEGPSYWFVASCTCGSGLFVPIFDVLADPALVGRLSAEGEEAGWDGVFVYDHVRWREPVLEVADASITLAAIAAATQAVRLGPMVTPLARRRPVKVAREYPRKRNPLRRAARFQGFFPVGPEHPDQLAEIVAELTTLRRQIGRDLADPYDVVTALPPGTDPAPYVSAGATWWMVEFPLDGLLVDRVCGVIRDGPAPSP